MKKAGNMSGQQFRICREHIVPQKRMDISGKLSSNDDILLYPDRNTAVGCFF